MNRSKLFMVLVVAALVALPGVAGANGDSDFGDNVAGAYVGEVVLPNGFVLLRLTLTINADGTWTTSDESDHTGLYNDTPLAGAWAKSGARQIRLKALSLYSDPASPVNQIEGVYRIEGTIDFARGFDTATGVYVQSIFHPDQIFNPLRPNTTEPPLSETPALPANFARIVP